MLCGREGNRKSGVALHAMRHSLTWAVYLSWNYPAFRLHAIYTAQFTFAYILAPASRHRVGCRKSASRAGVRAGGGVRNDGLEMLLLLLLLLGAWSVRCRRLHARVLCRAFKCWVHGARRRLMWQHVTHRQTDRRTTNRMAWKWRIQRVGARGPPSQPATLNFWTFSVLVRENLFLCMTLLQGRPKLDGFWELITLHRLVIERRVVCRKFPNFFRKKV